jgi:hypothetical protein
MTGHRANDGPGVQFRRLARPWLSSARLGLLALALWAGWWALSSWQGRLALAEHTWIRLPAYGVDFQLNIDRPTRLWVNGANPYLDPDPLFCYPPIVLRLFAWTTLLRPWQALRAWQVILALLAAMGALVAVRWRGRLSLHSLPASAAVALILCSMPVLFAMERGNYDLLVLPFLVAGVLVAERPWRGAASVGGLMLAVAVWLKLYPGLVLPGLLVLRRPRLGAWAIAWVGIIGLSFASELGPFLANSRLHVQQARFAARLAAPEPAAYPWNHPLGLTWSWLWSGTPLARLPGDLAAAAAIGVLVVGLSWHVWRQPDSWRLALPYLLWLVAAGTFVVPVSNDYNLTPLPLALVAVWDRRRPSSYLAAGLLVLWCQPLWLPLPTRVLMLAKLAGLIGVAVALARSHAHTAAGQSPLPVAPPAREADAPHRVG